MTDFTSLIDSLNRIRQGDAFLAEDAEWNEGDHKRSDDGRFATMNGGGKTAAKGRGKGEPVKREYRLLYYSPSGRKEMKTTDVSLGKAVSNVSERICEGDHRFYKQIRTELISVDGHKPKNRVIIDNDDPNRKELIKRIDAEYAAYFDRQASNPSHGGGGSGSRTGETTHPESLPDRTRDLRDVGATGGSGSLGRAGHNDKGGTSGSGSKPTGRIVQPTFSFDHASDFGSTKNKKKWFYRSLIASLIALKDADENDETAAAVTPGLTDGSGKSAAKGGESGENHPISRAREVEQNVNLTPPLTSPGRVEVISLTPKVDPKEAVGLMKPNEVREMINRNCGLIKTVDKDLIPGIERRIKRLYEHTNTTRETLARYLENTCDLEPWQAERIINDQMNKYDARANLARLKSQGVKLVRWVHGDCQVPREYHIRHWDGHSGLRNGHPNGLAGFVFDIDNPPVIDEKTGERGFPGDLIMCSCHLEAVE